MLSEGFYDTDTGFAVSVGPNHPSITWDHVTPGTGASDCTGSLISVHNFQVSLDIDPINPVQVGAPPTTYSSTALRMVWFLDTQSQEIPLNYSWTDVFEADDIHSAPIINMMQRYRILHDEIYALGTPSVVYPFSLIDPGAGS